MNPAETAGILKDWLGDGCKPVHPGVAESRAKTCEVCPKNQDPRWWEMAVDLVAGSIRQYIEHKNSLELSVPNESNLGMCRVCGCCLPLKVHVPLDHILKNTKTETLARFPENCWITKETP
jgi:hypothetical protein